MLDAMASPLFSATWWLPALHRGEISPDDLIEALLPWGKDHRIVTGDGHTYSGLVELLRITRPWDIRFLQVLPGAYSELPTTPPGTHELVESATEEESVLSTTALGELISTAGGEALALGHPHEHPDGPFEVSFMTPLRDVVLWRLVPFPGQLPPIVNAGPRAALGDLRRAEEASLQRLQHTPHIISEQQDEDFRNALIDIDSALLISDSVTYPPSVEGHYLQLIFAADHVAAIVSVTRHYAQTAETALIPLLRTAQRARGTAWNEWRYHRSPTL